MNAPHQFNWTEEDREFAEEFSETSSAWQQQSTPVRKVPWGLNHRVRRLARLQSGEDLTSSWVWGAVPKLSLVAMMVFVVGVYVLMQKPDNVTLPQADGNRALQMSPESLQRQIDIANQVAPPMGSWIVVRIESSADGEIRGMTVVERCIQVGGVCRNLTQYDELALSRIKTTIPGDARESEIKLSW